ncbi:hypothetical protein INT43_007530 [Umbelopsis isabellina]|uniref:Non-hemolytic phospholipase C n=1 Tax=Mortierella isabellina TaxID=91625 RepID=A0A8H7PMY0_MORIS|nr:hypothetical protein INT43_007530 [Umbelopsis isabellina]
MKAITICAAIAATLAFADAAPTKKTTTPSSSGLSKIKHMVYFMQENRSFDHYYGTMAGVRNFADPNVGVQSNGNNLFYQPDTNSPDKKNGSTYLLPFQFTGNRAGCTVGGSNSWTQNHNALNGGLNNNWPQGNSPMSMGYETRSEIPFHFALAESFTIADMYFQSVTGSTNPNRVVWMSGTNSYGGYTLEDNTESPALKWGTYPQNLTAAGVSWQLFQDKDNFDDNALAWFSYWQNLPSGAEKNKGLGVLGLQAFYDRAANGTLPQVSIIVGDTELSEHPDNTPMAGAWLQQQVVNAVMHSPAWNQTALIINYDESGGFFDHVVPPQAPSSEYVVDKWTGKKVPIGFGPRVPLVCVSPYCRGGNVFTEVADHTATLRLLEEWVGQNANGTYKAPASLISPWHRSTTSNLINLFDFNNPDFSIPTLPTVAKPATNSQGVWDPTEMCEGLSDPKSTPPYGKQTFPTVETGSKPVRGALTEGRTLVIRPTTSTSIQVAANGKLAIQKTSKQGSQGEAFSVHQSGDKYAIRSIGSGNCLSLQGNNVTLANCATADWTINYIAESASYQITHAASGKHLSAGSEHLQLSKKATSFKLYSVSF